MTRTLLALSILLLGTEAIRLWWLHPSGERWDTTRRPTLDLSAMEQTASLISLPLEGNIDTGFLRFDHADYLRGEHDQGNLSVLFFSYRPNNRNLWSDLFSHPPEVCMRSSGCTHEGTMPTRFLKLGEEEIPVRILKYRDPTNGAALFVLRAIWLPPGSPIQPGNSLDDLRDVWVAMAIHRIPHPPGAVLLTGIWGVEEVESAWKIFQNRVAPHLHLSVSG